MSLSEFQIIQNYFTKNKYNSQIIKSIGDDAAVVDCSNQSKLIISIDTLISGVHFPAATSAYDIAYKSLAVNLSDLAAMGASPSWFTLALSIPDSDTKWLSEFSSGLFELAESFNIDLIGGDTTTGPLSITIQIAGYVNDDKIMYRNGAKVADNIYVSGTIGDAGAGLSCINDSIHQNEFASDYFISRLNRPSARIQLGNEIREFATACIDISDGMLADLNHITKLSNVGANVILDDLPLSDSMITRYQQHEAINFALFSGDDYELCFCAAEKYHQRIQSIASEMNVNVTKIGDIINGERINCFLNKKKFTINDSGYEHFKNKI